MDKLFNWLCLIFGAVGGCLAPMLGGYDKWLQALVIFVIFDYITGVIKAFYKHRLSSEIGFKGIMKKVLIFIVVAVSVVMQDLVNNAVPCREIVVCFYLANEGLSLFENIAEFLPIPQKIKDVLLQVRDKASVVKETVKEEIK